MSTTRRSWDLKVERAEQHVDEVKAAMAAYADSNPFRPVRVRQLKGQRNVWLYRLEMTEEPDPMIPVIIGECLYDLRLFQPGPGRWAERTVPLFQEPLLVGVQ